MFKLRSILIATALAWAAPVDAQLTSDNFGELVEATITAVKAQYPTTTSMFDGTAGVDVRSEASNRSMADAAVAFLGAPARNYRDVTLDQELRCAPPPVNRGDCEMVSVDFLVTIGEIRRDGDGFRVPVQLNGVNTRSVIPVWTHTWEVILVLTEAGEWRVTRVIEGYQT